MEKNKTQWDWDAFLYLAPALLIIFTFHVFPILLAFLISFYKWNLITDARYVGLVNYQKIINDPMFWKAIKNTIFYAIGSVPLGILIALSIALLLNNKLKGLGIYRTLYFLPVITSMNAVSMVWQWIYHERYGVLNYFISLVGLGPINWLEDVSFAMPAIIIMSVWKSLGYNVVIFLAGLQNIPTHLYEAAEIDGASPWQRFLHITFPLLSPVTFFVLVMSTISSFQVFAQVYILTPNGGPMGSTTVLVYYLYQMAFNRFRFGYAAAIAFVLFLIIFAMTAFQKFVIEKRVHYR
ncbi:carbohydrate ABC transporter permease [Candidatus Riflebacteria bacterium]